MSKVQIKEVPSVELLETELNRERYKQKYILALKSTAYALLAVAAVAVLVATLWMPILRIYGSSMSPSLEDGQIIFTMKTARFKNGDIVSFYYNNKILVKRVIGQAGDVIDIDEDGTVYVNEVKLNEPYIKEKALGECDIELPFQVPAGKLFVLGDNRETSVDSRSTALGCVTEEQIVGKILFCVWPLKNFGKIE